MTPLLPYDSGGQALRLADQCDLARMTDDLWRLVQIPSPTGRERQAALAFAEMLRQAGAEVQIDETLPNSPSVIGRLVGRRPGRTFQLAGHIDHIDVAHAPPHREEGVIHGRGAADMKNGLAGILETVRLLHGTGCDFAGSVLVTVYGLHEAPVGDSAGLMHLMERGIVGQAALVAENAGPADDAIIAGKGQSIWNIYLRRQGPSCHELLRPADADKLLRAALEVAAALQAHSGRLASQPNHHGLLTPESLFIGQMHYGDFYNRAPSQCHFQGTRRWQPHHDFAQVKQELSALLSEIPLPAGLRLESDWTFVGESYEMSADEPVVRAFQAAHDLVTGGKMTVAGTSVVCDSNRLVPLAHVPTVLLGFDNQYAHADDEQVRLDQLLPSCRVMLLTVMNYLNAFEHKG